MTYLHFEKKKLHSIVILKNEAQNYLHDLTRRHASVQLDHESYSMGLDICINQITLDLIIHSTFKSKMYVSTNIIC